MMNIVIYPLKYYINQSITALTDDPIHYWINIWELLYPSLKIIAKQYLPIVATSVPSRRLFSKAGNILTEKS